MRLSWAFLIFVFLYPFPPSADAQSTTGRITGLVRDASGAIVPGVGVIATDTEAGRSWTSTSDETGTYQFPTLPPGLYRLTAERAGFQPFAADARLELNQVVRLDITLEVGSLRQAVEVRSDAFLQTDSTERGMVIGAHEASRLPANGRNFITLTLLAPGVVATNAAALTHGQRTTGGGRPYVNGNRREANNFLLDGVEANQTTDNLVAYQPSPDAIGELKLISANAPAEFGNYQGAIISVTLKSGTNRLRGTLFEFLRNDALNATSWAGNHSPPDPLNPRRKTPLRHNVFGGTIGGPLVPNRLFFFGDYQGTRRRTGYATGFITLIPAAMRRGDFSALLEGPNPQQLYDPLTTRPDPGGPGRWIRDPFPSNQIPLDRIDPVSAALFSSPFYPRPALPGLTANAFNTTRATLDNDQFDIKIDAKVTPRDDLSARYAHGLQTTTGTNSQAFLMGTATRSPFEAAVLHWTRQLGGHTVNEARVGLSRVVVVQDGGVDIGGLGNFGEALGIPGANRRGPGSPELIFSDAAAKVGSAKVVQDFGARTFQFQDNLIWHGGGHAVKAGAQVVRHLQDVYYSGNTGQLGIMQFSGQYTRDLNDPRSTGSPIADFLLGYPQRMARGDFAEPWQHRSTLWAGFVQDDWRVTKRLTLNLGLRYEYRTPLVEARDRQVNFDLATGRALYAGKDGNGRALYRGYKKDWQPRMGVAWTPARWSGRLVVRGAYGVSSFLEGTGTNLRLTLNPPFFNEFETVNSDPAVIGLPTSAGFDALREKDPLVGTILRAWDPRHRPARSQQWNITGEYRLARGVLVSLGYVGQYGAHLVVPVNFNQRASPGGPRPFDAVYPQIAAVILTTPNANQRYDGLQVHARKRLSGGGAFTASYTLSRALTHGRGFFSEIGQAAEPSAFWPNPRDRDADWGPAAADVRHNLAVAAIWDLPWGRDRRFLSSAPRWLDAIVGGWSVAAIWKAHTGFPITVFAPDQSQTGARSGRPDCIGTTEGPRQVGPGRWWFNTSVFVLPRPGTFGNCGVGVVRGPGLNVVDLSATKKIALTGRIALELQADAFNLLNTPAFEAPDRNLTNATFGQVVGAQLAREVQLGIRIVF